MVNLFKEVLDIYAGKWQVSDRRSFTEDEINSVERTEIVKSQYGNSVCFYLRSGGMAFIPCATDMQKGVGEPIDMKKAEVLTLSKKGEADILRVRE